MNNCDSARMQGPGQARGANTINQTFHARTNKWTGQMLLTNGEFTHARTSTTELEGSDSQVHNREGEQGDRV
jgi:hypothetical protein